MKSIIIITLAIVASTLIFSSCKKADGGEGNGEELITTMKLTFSAVGAGTPLTFSFDDADGPGGNPPTQDIIQLQANTTYNVSVQLLNATETPAEDITLEVAEENEAHRFYYIPSAGSLITISDLNNDDSGVPLGITSKWSTGSASSGTVGVTLRHYPGTPPDKQSADPVNSPKSSTDMSVTFSYTVL